MSLKILLMFDSWMKMMMMLKMMRMMMLKMRMKMLQMMMLQKMMMMMLKMMMMLQMQQCSRPTVHVDSFLYDEDQVDSLCDEGTMSRSFCLTCGSYRTAPLGLNIIIFISSDLTLLLLTSSSSSPSDFISHSFSISELQFLFENVLPDLSGQTLVDLGSRLGAVLYAVSRTQTLIGGACTSCP